MKSISLILLCQLLLGHSEVRAIRKEYKCEVINSLQQIYVKYIEPISRGLIYNSSLEGAVFHFRTAGRGLFQRAAQKSFNANDPRNDQEKVNVLFQEFLQDKDKKQIKKIPGGYPYGCRTWKCSKSTGQYFTVGCVFTAKNFSLAWQFTSTFDTFFKKLNSGTIWDSGLSDQAVTLLSNINMNTTSDQIKTKVQTTLRVVDEESIRTALSVLLRHMYDDEQLKKIRRKGSGNGYGCAMAVIHGKFLNLACLVKGLGSDRFLFTLDRESSGKKDKPESIRMERQSQSPFISS